MAKKPVPEGVGELGREARIRLLAWHVDQWPYHFEHRSARKGFIRTEAEKALDWARANGKRYHDYEAFLRNWLRRSMEQRGFEPRRPPSSPLIPHGKRPFTGTTEFEKLGPLFSGLGEK